MLGLSLAEKESTHALHVLCRLIQSLVDPFPLTSAPFLFRPTVQSGIAAARVACAAASNDLIVLRVSVIYLICFHLQKMVDKLYLLPGDGKRGKHKHNPTRVLLSC